MLLTCVLTVEVPMINVAAIAWFVAPVAIKDPTHTLRHRCAETQL